MGASRQHALSRGAAVTTGLARVLEDPGIWFEGRRFGLVANSSARAPDGRPAHIALGAACPDQLRVLLTPEHGMHATAAAGAPVPNATTGGGLRVLSLYQARSRRPSRAMLAGLDLLVLDLQDVGVRYYTYLGTMLECLEAVAEYGIALMVLDRPNPLGGLVVEGPGVDPGCQSFIAALDVPIRHGLTLGELARMAVDMMGLAPDCLEVVPAVGWQRGMLWPDTGLIWYPPSPAARSLNMVALYPATCLIEGTTVSEGRGTDAPFELIGAPWLDEFRLAQDLTAMRSGIADGWPTATPVRFHPRQHKWAGAMCHGVRLEAPPSGVSLTFGLALLTALRQQDPAAFAWRHSAETPTSPLLHIDQLAGGPSLRQAVEAGISLDQVAASWQEREHLHRLRSAPYLLYGDSSSWLAGKESALKPEEGGAKPVSAVPVAVAPPLPPPPPPEMALDQSTGVQVVHAITASAQRAVDAVTLASPAVGLAIERVATQLASGGRLLYVGAGTSGRIGMLDASECGPTFGALPGQVTAIMAGGPEAMQAASEGSEDDEQAARDDIRAAAVGPADAVVGLAASGSTPYTVAAIREARRAGALTIAVVGATHTPLGTSADIAIEVPCGPEPLRGSSRLGAGTAQKLVCNAISTGAFARLGLVYGDYMVGVQPANAKLRARAAAIIAQLSGCAPEQAVEALARAMAYDRRAAVRLAVLHLAAQVSLEEAQRLLIEAGGSLRAAMEAAAKTNSAPSGHPSPVGSLVRPG